MGLAAVVMGRVAERGGDMCEGGDMCDRALLTYGGGACRRVWSEVTAGIRIASLFRWAWWLG